MNKIFIKFLYLFFIYLKNCLVNKLNNDKIYDNKIRRGKRFLNYARLCRNLFSKISFFNFFNLKKFNHRLQDFKDFSFIFENLDSSFSKVFLLKDYFSSNFLNFKNGLFFFLKVFLNRKLFRKSIF